MPRAPDSWQVVRRQKLPLMPAGRRGAMRNRSNVMTDTNETRKTTSKATADAASEQVQQQVQQEQEQGFRGVEIDPTPNEAYTVAGVTSGQPTPETDPEQAATVGSTRFRGSAEERR
jgi:hypothetical protein